MSSTGSPAVTPNGRVVIALSGGRGLAYGVRLLEILGSSVETHLVLGGPAAAALGAGADAVRALADQVYAEGNQAARISSGSFLTRGMIVAPCDAASLAAIVMGLATNLVYRAADVTLKESRPLVLGIPAAAMAAVGHEMLARAAVVPGLVVLALEADVDPAAALLLAQLGIEDVHVHS